MRFAAVIRKKRQKHAAAPAPQANRQPVPDELTSGDQPGVPQPQHQEVPVDLDQRVRLVGEW
jgi:hypothetical protein